MRQAPDAQLIRYFTVGSGEALMATGLQAVKEILQGNVYSFVKPASFVRMTKPIAGEGLGLIEGNEHKQARKLLNIPFGTDKVRNLVPVFRQKTRDLVARFEKCAETGEKINVVTAYSSLTLDIIVQAVLGIDLKTYAPDTPFHECYNRLFDPPLVGQILIAINSIIPIRWLPLKENRIYKQNHEAIHGMVRRIVTSRLDEVENLKNGTDGKEIVDISDSKDILSHMIYESNASGEPWSVDKIHGHVGCLFPNGSPA
jgi:cytochrome P450